MAYKIVEFLSCSHSVCTQGKESERKHIDRANTKNQPNAFTIQLLLNKALTVIKVVAESQSNCSWTLCTPVQFTLNAINTRHFICTFNTRIQMKTQLEEKFQLLRRCRKKNAKQMSEYIKTR